MNNTGKLEMIKNAIWAFYPFVKIKTEEDDHPFTNSVDYRMSIKWCFRGMEYCLARMIRENDEFIGNSDAEWVAKEIINEIQRTTLSGLIKQEK